MRELAKARQSLRALALAFAVPVLVSCASTRINPPARPTPLALATKADARPSGAAVGLVLTGGGAFGAWEVGALEAFFDAWREKYGEDPPIRVVAGTSTGALIAPFAFLGREELAEAADWYTHVNQGDILSPKLGALLPFPLFAITTSSVYSTGYTDNPNAAPGRLYGKLKQVLSQERLKRIGAAWPKRRMVAATLDFGTGKPDPISNSPDNMPRLVDGIFASAMAPLALPPIPVESAPGNSRKTPHLDGGVYAVAPFEALFEIAAQPPEIHLTHVVVVSAFPLFPSNDDSAVQGHRFPNNPKFKAVGDRMNVLISEAGASADIRLARAAVAMRCVGTSTAEVEVATGLRIPGSSPILIELLPSSRLGWEALQFRVQDMKMMYDRGLEEGRMQLLAQISEIEPCRARRGTVH
jgi:predicted acylesterase/phospholipase RssA